MNMKTLIAAAVALAFAAPLAAQQAPGGAAGTAPGATGATTQSGAKFEDLDKNKDGSLSREEMKGSPKEKDFSSLDKDKDGKLSRGEYEGGAAAGGTSGAAGSEGKKQ